MATIRTSILVTDGMSTAFKSMNRALNLVLSSFEKVQSASGKAVDTATIHAARTEINNASAALVKMEQEIERVKSGANKTEKSFAGWQRGIIVANQAMGLIKSTMGNLGVFSMDKAFSRLDTMSQFNRTVGILTGNQNAARAALESLKDTTLGTAYGLDVAAKAAQNFVTRRMGLAKATNQVRIWADAVSFYGRGTNDQLETVVDALGKMRTKGSVEMEQLNRLFDVGINAVQIYADAMGRSAAEVQDDLTAKSISSAQFIDTISEAMDKGMSAGAAKSAGQNWATTFANVQAAIARGWVSAIEKVDQSLIRNGLPKTMEIVKRAGSVMESIIKKLGDIAGITTRLIPLFVALGKTMMIVGTIYALDAGIKMLKISMLNAGMATKGTATAVRVLTASMLTNPLFLGIAAVAAVTGVIYALDRYNSKIREASNIVQVQTLSVKELNKAQRDASKSYQDSYSQAEKNASISEKYIKVIERLENASNRNAYEQKQLQASVNGLNSIYPSLGIKIDSVTGKLNMNSSAIRNNIANLKNLAQAQAMQDKLKSTYDTIYEAEATIEVAKSKRDSLAATEQRLKNNVSDPGTNSLYQTFGSSALKNADKEYYEALKSRISLEQEAVKLTNKIANLGVDISSQLDAGLSINDGYLDTVDKINSDLNISDEDLKYLRDIAERDAINRFATAEIKVEMSNSFGDIRETADVDGIIDRLATKIEEQMAVSAEGVYS